jgi:hypothetical protein
MSIHFRSRIQSPVNYSAFLFPGTNGCCCTGSSSDLSFAFTSTVGECNALGGYFSVAENCSTVNCLPRGTTGCCCACSYGGMTEGIERTVCEDLDGVWQEGACPEDPAAFCIAGDGRDVRDKRRCCGFTLSNGETLPQCYDVCLARECVLLTVGDYTPTFYPTPGSCDTHPPCSGLSDNLQISFTPPDTGQPSNDVYGNCCVQDNPCRCYESVTFNVCERLNGTFYLMGEKDYPCSECLNNCSREES